MFTGLRLFIIKDIKAVCSDCENIKVTPRKISLYSRSFCKTDYNELKESPYAKNECFAGNFIYELLIAGYRLSPNMPIRVTNSLNGFKLGWTMGAVLENTAS
ncbi:Ectonucleoside triphosphate diphosphohydrolase 3 [Desmophyllum pertusum]|uniref:Ectonucleoside triphosphate diphosphohydrolase 3 n=1 Tax=Desmophyllum pertusum TaxID=174260 RepID=A0A9W9ZLX4_9CNID|nr:Ectonucleoside triphosphate diphosphohydrolase 3 [Desmophyllum pertusum]